MRTNMTELTAFFDALQKWCEAEDAKLFFAQMMLRRRPSPIGRLAPFGCVNGLGALGAWGCGGGGNGSSLFT